MVLHCSEDLSESDGHVYIEYFDCLGIKVDQAAYLLRSYTGYVGFNEHPTMDYRDSLCSEFSIYFIVNRIHNPELSFHEFMNEYFSNDLQDNKRLVLSFMKDMY
jgi:hypothetical protein